MRPPLDYDYDYDYERRGRERDGSRKTWDARLLVGGYEFGA